MTDCNLVSFGHPVKTRETVDPPRELRIVAVLVGNAQKHRHVVLVMWSAAMFLRVFGLFGFRIVSFVGLLVSSLFAMGGLLGGGGYPVRENREESCSEDDP